MRINKKNENLIEKLFSLYINKIAHGIAGKKPEKPLFADPPNMNNAHRINISLFENLALDNSANSLLRNVMLGFILFMVRESSARVKRNSFD